MATSTKQLETELKRLEDEVRQYSARRLSNKPPPVLLSFDEPSVQTDSEPEAQTVELRQKPKRKEIEARRFSGKENVVEYLMQFELTVNTINGMTMKKRVLCYVPLTAQPGVFYLNSTMQRKQNSKKLNKRSYSASVRPTLLKCMSKHWANYAYQRDSQSARWPQKSRD